MRHLKEKPFKLLIRKLPNKNSNHNEVAPYFFDIVLIRKREVRGLYIFLARVKPQYYSDEAAASLLTRYMGEQVTSSDIEFKTPLYLATMPNLVRYSNPNPVLTHYWWSCKDGLYVEEL